jgi:hypothetical protein
VHTELCEVPSPNDVSMLLDHRMSHSTSLWAAGAFGLIQRSMMLCFRAFADALVVPGLNMKIGLSSTKNMFEMIRRGVGLVIVLRITGVHGEQVVDPFAWVRDARACLPTPAHARDVLKVVADTVKMHDMTYMACFPGMIGSGSVLAMSCGPYDVDGFNGGEATD